MVLQQQYNTKLILEIWCQQIRAVLLQHPQQLLDQCKQIPGPALPSYHLLQRQTQILSAMFSILVTTQARC